MSSNVILTSSPFSRGNVFLFIFTLNAEISWLSQSSGVSPEASMIARIALAVALHGVDESSLDAAAARLLRPPPAERAGIKELILRDLVVEGVVVDGAVDIGARGRRLIGPTGVEVSGGAPRAASRYVEGGGGDRGFHVRQDSRGMGGGG